MFSLIDLSDQKRRFMDHAVKLTINGETREFPMGITYKEVVKEYGKRPARPLLFL